MHTSLYERVFNYMSVSQPDARDIGSRLKQVRESLGLTQPEFASRLGLHYQTYRNYEAGDRDATVGVILALTTDGFSPTWLLTGVGPKKVPDYRAVIATASLALDDASAALKLRLTSKKRAEVLGELVMRAVELDADEGRARAEATTLLRLAAA